MSREGLHGGSWIEGCSHAGEVGVFRGLAVDRKDAATTPGVSELKNAIAQSCDRRGL